MKKNFQDLSFVDACIGKTGMCIISKSAPSFIRKDQI